MWQWAHEESEEKTCHWLLGRGLLKGKVRPATGWSGPTVVQQ